MKRRGCESKVKNNEFEKISASLMRQIVLEKISIIFEYIYFLKNEIQKIIKKNFIWNNNSFDFDEIFYLIFAFIFLSFTGANLIYKSIIQPIFNKHESDIDAALNSIDPKSVLDAAVALGKAASSGKKSE